MSLAERGGVEMIRKRRNIVERATPFGMFTPNMVADIDALLAEVERLERLARIGEAAVEWQRIRPPSTPGERSEGEWAAWARHHVAGDSLARLAREEVLAPGQVAAFDDPQASR